MLDYKKLYYHLFNAITDALTELDEGRILEARLCLVQAQCGTEELYIQDAEAIDEYT